MQSVPTALETLITAERQQPVFKVSIYDTPKTVPSKGFNVAFYTLESNDDMIAGDWFTTPASPLLLSYPSASADLSNVIEPASAMTFDWGIGGSPAPLTKSDLYAVRWYGKFFARYSGVYKFYLDCSPHSRIRIKFDGSYLTLKDSSGTTVSTWVDTASTVDTKKELVADTSSLTAGNWYDIQIEFWQPRKRVFENIPTYMCVKYKEPDATTSYDEIGNEDGDYSTGDSRENVVTDYQSDHLIKKVLSAGVVNIANSFLSPTVLTNVLNASGKKEIDQASEYRIDVPLPFATELSADVSIGASTIAVETIESLENIRVGKIGSDTFTFTGVSGSTLTGVSGVGSNHDEGDVVYFYPASEYPFDKNDNTFGDIKPFQLCVLEIGFKSFPDASPADTSYYTKRITGFISRNPSIKRSSNETILTIYITDFRSLLIRKFNENYPNYASYSSAGYYTGEILNEPNGISRPQAYDYWRLSDAVRDIMMKANIDPILFYRKKRHNRTGGANYLTDFGEYLIWSDIQLDGQNQYGSPTATDSVSPDEKYRWFFGYGEILLDSLSKLAKNFSYHLSFDGEGSPIFKPISLPTVDYSISNSEVGDNYLSNPEFTTNINGYFYTPLTMERVDSSSDPGSASPGSDSWCGKFSYSGDQAILRAQFLNFQTPEVPQQFTFSFYVPTGSPDMEVGLVHAPSGTYYPWIAQSGDLTVKDAWETVVIVFTMHIEDIFNFFVGQGIGTSALFYIDKLEHIETTGLVFSVAGGATQTDGTNLLSYRGAYTSLVKNAGTATILLASVEFIDFIILFNALTGATGTTEIKIEYNDSGWLPVTDIVWNGVALNDVSGVFDLSLDSSDYPSNWYYYQGLSPASGYNPAIIYLSSLFAYNTYDIRITVTGGAFEFGAILLFRESINKAVLEFNTNDQVSKIQSMVHEIEDTRNIVTVVGAEQGKVANQDSQVLNPNNPVYIHVYSKSIDVDSIYKYGGNSYVGTDLPVIIESNRIYNADRADHISKNTLLAYRQPIINPSFEVFGDPRAEPFDPVTFKDNKYNISQAVWLKAITESFTKQRTYMTTISTVLSKPPVASFQEKREPDLNLFNNEPIINIQVKSQGGRICGGDATVSTNEITITTDPVWEDDVWNGYKFYDNDGVEFDIDDTVGSTKKLTLSGGPSDDGTGAVAGDWAVSFNPLDTNALGAPLEIHFDQVVNGRIQIYILDSTNQAIALVNSDNVGVIHEWGLGKVFYWSGAIDYNSRPGKTGYYINELTTIFEAPVKIMIAFHPSNVDNDIVSIDTNNSGDITVNGTVSLQSTLGPVQIYPVTDEDPPHIKIDIEGNTDYQIVEQGTIDTIVAYTDATGLLRITVNGFTFSDDDYNGYLIGISRIDVDEFSGIGEQKHSQIWRIDDTIGPDIILCYPVGAGATNRLNPHVDSYIEIIGDGGAHPNNGVYENTIYPHFKSSDNQFRGLRLKFSIENLYASPPAIYHDDIVVGGAQLREANCLFGKTGSDTIYSILAKTGNYFRMRDVVNNNDVFIQSNPKKGIFQMGFSDLMDTSLLPNSITRTREYLIKANLKVYKVSKYTHYSTISAQLDVYAFNENFIDTQGFVMLDDFEFFFKPENYIFGDESTPGGPQRLVNNEDTGWLFVFEFFFIDRLGRLSRNTYNGPTDPNEEEEQHGFYYIVGWQPEIGSHRIAHHKELGLSEQFFGDLRMANMYPHFGYWTNL
jgi:hypothetical protein